MQHHARHAECGVWLSASASGTCAKTRPAAGSLRASKACLMAYATRSLAPHSCASYTNIRFVLDRLKGEDPDGNHVQLTIQPQYKEQLWLFDFKGRARDTSYQAAGGNPMYFSTLIPSYITNKRVRFTAFCVDDWTWACLGT
jgi:hypothetical protein